MNQGATGQIEGEPSRGRFQEMVSRLRSWSSRQGLASILPEIDPLGLVLLAMGLYVARFTRMSFGYHRSFATSSYDLGLWDQGLWLMSRFQEPFSTIMGVHLFGDHLTFFLYLLVPLYWLWPSPDTLLVAQTVVLALGALAVYLLGRELLGRTWPALLLALAYLMHPAIQWTNLEQFHPDSFEVPLLLFGLLALHRRRWIAFLLIMAALLLVKEDVALLVAPLGAYVFWRHDRRIGAVVALAALAWLALSIAWLLPHYNEVGSYDAVRLPFGGVRGVLDKAVTAPWEVSAHMLTAAKQKYLFQLLSPFGFLPLLSPATLLAAGPLAVNLLSTHTYQSEIQYHYSTLIVPVLVYGTLLGVRQLTVATPRFKREVQFLLTLVVFGAALGSAYLWGPLNWAREPAQVPRPDPVRVQSVEKAIALIPQGSSVSAIHWLVPQTSQREEIYQFPTPWKVEVWQDQSKEGRRLPEADQVEYILVEPAKLDEEEKAILSQLISSEFAVLHDEAGVLLLKRR